MLRICIPAWNEAQTVGVLLWKVRRVMEEFPRDYELLVIDDASSDDTPKVLAPYARILPLTVLRNRRTEGYAAALERLLREATARATHPKRDVVVTLQADFTEDPRGIPELVRAIEGGADVANGVARPRGEVTRAWRWSRRGLNLLAPRRGLPARTADPVSGFRAMRAAVLRQAIAAAGETPLLRRSGWAANVELLLAVAPYARRIESVEVPVDPERRLRPTRFRTLDTARELWNLSRSPPARAVVSGKR